MNNNYIIDCTDSETFLKTCINLMKEGIHFNADEHNLKITLTGGY